jgi:hypothetical protein
VSKGFRKSSHSAGSTQAEPLARQVTFLRNKGLARSSASFTVQRHSKPTHRRHDDLPPFKCLMTGSPKRPSAEGFGAFRAGDSRRRG